MIRILPAALLAAAIGYAQPLPLTYERLLHPRAEPGNWLTYNGDYNSHHYSPLSQITAENISRLHAAWIFQMHRNKVEATPIVVNGIMYVSRPPSDVLAIDARNGRTLWTWTYRLPEHVFVCCGEVNRGVAVLGNRVFVNTLDAHLVALDARTGRLLWKKQLADSDLGYSATVAPLIVKDKVITGAAGAEGGIRGYLDAYYAETGERAWRFYIIPTPGEPGSETWAGDSWKHGGGSTWITGSFDPALNLIYWGTGNPGPDLNGDVRPGDNLYTCSMIALDADSGKLKWHYQYTPHDVHDWDSTQVPVLLDSTVNGKPRKLLLHANRNGFFYALDRQTGEFLFAKPLSKQTWVKEFTAKGRPIVNPGQEPTPEGNDDVWPGMDGAANWMSPSYSPLTKLFYVDVREERRRYQKSNDVEFRPGEMFFGGGGGARFRPEESWGHLSAIVPETGELKWEHRVVSPPWGGVLSTAGNLVFCATLQGNFYAVDARTGKELWHFPSGDRVYASPVSYLADGKQYIAVALGDNLVAFTLD